MDDGLELYETLADNLRNQLAASEARERMLRDACRVARTYLRSVPVADWHWHTGVVQALDAALAGEEEPPA